MKIYSIFHMENRLEIGGKNVKNGRDKVRKIKRNERK